MITDQKTKAATILALVMHLAGLTCILWGMNGAFEKLTPFNLLVMFTLVIFTLPEKKIRFFLFMVITILTGFFVEMLGVHTGILFGNYKYGNALGLKLNDVPILIGINWFIVVYACGMSALQLRTFLGRFLPVNGRAAFTRWIGFSLIFDGALIATFFDWIMEPAAVKLGFWNWNGGHIPIHNYFSWFWTSLLLLFLFRLLKLKYHPFAVNLLLIQVIFFLLIR